jgi:glycosyltransferase involved in cell wall biosynthesis
LAVALGRIAHLTWRLVLIGAGPFKEEFDGLLEQAGVRSRVTHLGFVPHEETPRHLSAMDVLILPSETQPNWKEQFGRVIPEALACGTAVVGSDSGEIPRLIRESGGGLVFPERDVVALAAAIAQLISSPGLREKMASRGRDWVTSNLSLPKIAGRMAEVIERAVAQRKHDARENQH